VIVYLPFPPADLSGHTKGHWRDNSKLVATLRAEAFHLTRAAKRAQGCDIPDTGDIPISITFCPPDNRGDRLNFASRFKPLADGLAEALSINDKRLLPSYSFLPPAKPGYVEVII
jgi:crossover junction endodeoxyribonuclease RusA